MFWMILLENGETDTIEAGSKTKAVQIARSLYGKKVSAVVKIVS